MKLKKAKKSASAGGAQFSQLLSQAGDAEESQAATPVAETAAATPVSTLLSLQEIPEDQYQDRKAAAQGKITLNKLEELRHQLLTGRVSPSTLRGLEQVIAAQRKLTAFNPNLKSLLDEIELRAAVELAKLQKFSSAP